MPFPFLLVLVHTCRRCLFSEECGTRLPSPPVCVHYRCRRTNSIDQRVILVAYGWKSRGSFLTTEGGEVTSLHVPPTSRSSAGHNNLHFIDTKVQTVGDGGKGQAIEHYVKVPSPAQSEAEPNIWPKKAAKCSPLTWLYVNPHTRSVELGFWHKCSSSHFDWK